MDKYVFFTKKMTMIFLSIILLNLSVAIYAEEPKTTAEKPVPLAAKQQTVPLNHKTTIPAAAKAQNTIANSLAESKSISPVRSPPIIYDEETKELAQEVKKLQLEQSKLTLEHEKELIKIQQEKEKLFLVNELHMAKQNQLLAELNAANMRLELENAIHEHKQKQMLAYLVSEQEKLALQNSIQEEKNKQQDLKFQLESAQLEYQLLKLKFDKEQLEIKIAKRDNYEEWDSQVNKPKEYLKEPFVNGTLIVSDRKVVIDEPIWPGTADYVIERIQYYNNKMTEYPIFLIIDYCPGGSVMEGSRILKAMKNSRAPVYVVVKSLAASMAAVITTLAKRSYALPDAIIIHHQVWGFSWGNKTEQREQLAILDEWSERIMQPIAEKMGLTLPKLVERMYENNSRGDWFEFANVAVNYKWVDYIVEDIKDFSYIKQPTTEEKEDTEELIILSRQESIDPAGHRYVKVPHLRSMDVYHLYNPDNYYRY